MSIQENYEKYKYHFDILGLRDSRPCERLSILRSSLFQPSESICAFAELLRIFNAKYEQTVTEAALELQLKVQAYCISLRSFRASLTLDDINSDKEAIPKLEAALSSQHLVDEAFQLAKLIKEHSDDLPEELKPADVRADSVNQKGRYIQALLDVLVNPDEPEIPDDILEAHSLLSQLGKGGIGNANLLEMTLGAAKHPLPVIRNMAATLLRHYQSEQATLTLIDLLLDESEEVVAHAASSLGFLKSREAIPALIQCLERTFDDTSSVGWIVEALANMPDERALKPLIRLLDELMKKPHSDNRIETLPIAGVRKAIQAIGGEEAEDALAKYFGEIS